MGLRLEKAGTIVCTKEICCIRSFHACAYITPGEVAYAGNVEEEKDEWFERHVSDTIIRPWAMMIHVGNASIALAAVMHA